MQTGDSNVVRGPPGFQSIGPGVHDLQMQIQNLTQLVAVECGVLQQQLQTLGTMVQDHAHTLHTLGQQRSALLNAQTGQEKYQQLVAWVRQIEQYLSGMLQERPIIL